MVHKLNLVIHQVMNKKHHIEYDEQTITGRIVLHRTEMYHLSLLSDMPNIYLPNGKIHI